METTVPTLEPTVHITPPPVNLAADPSVRSVITSWLGKEVGTLALDFPSAPNLRGHILRRTQIWVPETIADQDILAYLVENMPDVRKAHLAQNRALQAARPTPSVAAPSTLAQAMATDPSAVPSAPMPAVTPLVVPEEYPISVAYDEEIQGRRYYNRTDHLSGTFRLSNEDLRDIVSDVNDADDEDEIRHRIIEYLKDSDQRHDFETIEGVETGGERIDEDTEGTDNYVLDVNALLSQFYLFNPDLAPGAAEPEEEEPVDSINTPLPDPTEEEDDESDDEDDEDSQLEEDDDEEDEEPEEEDFDEDA
jgi:hypothetical protein